MSSLALHLANLQDSKIASGDQIRSSDLAALLPKLKSIQKQFLDESKNSQELVQHLRMWTRIHEDQKIIQDTLNVALDIRNKFKAEAFVVIGIGGSDLGSRTLHAALNSTQHNLLSKKDRGGAPLVFFTGDTFEPNELHDILQVLEERNILHKTIFNVISKSGTTSETISAFLILKERLQKKLKSLKKDPKTYARQIVATTGLNEKSELFKLHQKDHLRAVLPVPDGVGGRFSFTSPVGLLFLAVTANEKIETPKKRLDEAVRGLKEGQAIANLDPLNKNNIAYQLASVNFLAEQRGKHSIVFYPYSKILRSMADWYSQLSTESLQKKNQGQNVIATCGPVGNHSILNGILEGRRDKLILFVRVEKFDAKKDFTVPKGSGIGGELTVLEGRKMSSVQLFSQMGTEINFTQNGILNATLTIPQVDTFHLFELMYTLEIATAVEGKLRGLEFKDSQGRLRDLTYEQDGVEGYKKETRRLLAKDSPQSAVSSRQ